MAYKKSKARGVTKLPYTGTGNEKPAKLPYTGGETKMEHAILRTPKKVTTTASGGTKVSKAKQSSGTSSIKKMQKKATPLKMQKKRIQLRSSAPSKSTAGNNRKKYMY